MPTALNRRQLTVLAGLLLILVGTATTWVVRRQITVETAVSSSPSAARADVRKNDAGGATGAHAVKLDALTMPRPEPVEGDRNPFQFGARAVPSPPPRPSTTNGQLGGPPPVLPEPINRVPSPAGPPSIALKFIGIVDAPTQGGKLAVLSDGRAVFYGHENEVVDGRFKIVRIGVESIELMSVDGRSRQTIRLSGQ